jgi:hypothetical protein
VRADVRRERPREEHRHHRIAEQRVSVHAPAARGIYQAGRPTAKKVRTS